MQLVFEFQAVSEQNAALHLRIIDEGPGISPQESAQLFQAFSQLNQAPELVKSGYGLGLYNTDQKMPVKKICEILRITSPTLRKHVREEGPALVSHRAKHRYNGRPKKLNKENRQLAFDRYVSKKHSIQEICATLGISAETLYKYVRAIDPDIRLRSKYRQNAQSKKLDETDN